MSFTAYRGKVEFRYHNEMFFFQLMAINIPHLFQLCVVFKVKFKNINNTRSNQ